MEKTPLRLAAPLGALLVLVACNQEPETVDLNPDPQAGVLANAAPVELPPSIQASRTYRCKDNSLVYIDFMSNNTALVRSAKGVEPPVATMTSETAGGEYKSADGYTVSGNAAQVSFTAPGKGTQSCKA
jgi:hypothetical protein